MSHLICHAGKRVMVIPNKNHQPKVIHRSDGSPCASQQLFQGKNTHTLRAILYGINDDGA